MFLIDQSVTHVSTCIFQGRFKNIVFRSAALVTKKLLAILDFFHRPDFFSALLNLKKNLNKNPIKIITH